MKNKINKTEKQPNKNMLNKAKHKTRLTQNLKAKHTTNVHTKQKERKTKVIESLGAIFLPHLGSTFPFSESLNWR